MRPLEEMGKFATVVVDPPWPLKPTGWATNPDNGLKDAWEHYDLMDINGIRQLPIAEVLAEDAFVFCWTVNSYLFDTRSIVEGWGCQYALTMTWIKEGGIQYPNGPAFNAEWIVVGRNGKPKYNEIKAFSTANYWPRGGHSEKPEGFYDLLRRVTPGPRLDIFGRRRIAGFESWGNEAPEGEALPDHYQQVLV